MGKLKLVHNTTHTIDADDNGTVTAWCSCGWRAQVDVRNLTQWEAFKKIYAARDAHAAGA